MVRSYDMRRRVDQEDRLRREGVIGGRYDDHEKHAAVLYWGECDVMECGVECEPGMRVCRRHAQGMAAAASQAL